jgi:hypothetical protein
MPLLPIDLFRRPIFAVSVTTSVRGVEARQGDPDLCRARTALRKSGEPTTGSRALRSLGPRRGPTVVEITLPTAPGRGLFWDGMFCGILAPVVLLWVAWAGGLSRAWLITIGLTAGILFAVYLPGMPTGQLDHLMET